MAPATVLSDNESEKTMNNNNDAHICSKMPIKNTENTCSCNKSPEDEGELVELVANPSETAVGSVDSVSKIQIQTTEHICSKKPPLKTRKCDSVISTPYQQLLCKTYQGHVVERTSCGKHLYCRTHSLFTNCVLNPCSSDPLPFSKDGLFRTQRHPKLSLRNFTKKQLFVLLSLAIGDFISSCSMSIMAPFFPKEATEKGMGVSVSGFVFSFYALVMFIMSPIIGKILPTFGAKPIFIAGLFLAGFSNLLFGFLPAIDDYNYFCCACFIIRGFEAIGAGAFSTASFVFVVEIFPDNISTVLGILETFIGLGMSVGPAIGGILYAAGGFGLPFFVLGISMIIVVPVNFCFLPSICGTNRGHSGSFLKILKIPSVFVIGLIVIMSSNIWSFLDPTLEPHLRQLNLTSNEIGLVFLLFSAIYGVFSLIWGWLADKVGNHWSMMVTGQFCSVICLIALGPSPIVTDTPNTLQQNLISLSLLGISVALTLMPTFQALLQCAVQHGHKREIATYSILAGAWSCMYSLGEVLGPTVGGVLLDNYGFPLCSTAMAAGTLMIGLGSLIFFSLQSTYTGVHEYTEERKPLIKNKDKRVYYTDLAGDACVIFVPTARSP